MKNILGIGNALVDIIYFLENDSLLKDFELPKGSMQLVDAGKADQIEKSAHALSKYMASGGSAANTIHGLARLGLNTAFIGTVGNDHFGNFFRDDMAAAGIKPLLSTGTIGTGRAISLVSQDGERTFGTYLGSAIELSSEIPDSSSFRNYNHLHLEGYLVPNQSLVENALRIAQSTGMSLSIDLASYNVVESNLDFLKRIIGQYKPIVFANEEEARAFSGFREPEIALDYISQYTSTAIVKTGIKGSIIFHRGMKYSADAIKVNCLDTTGAGDLYAAGYIYGFVNGMMPDKCGRIGSLLAGKVIEEAGAKICEKSWQFIDKTLSEI